MARLWMNRFLVVCSFFFFAKALVRAQETDHQSAANCLQMVERMLEQNRLVQDKFIDEADRNEFNTLHVEILGSTYTRYREFAKRMTPGLHEGDIFTRAALEESVKRISNMRSIYPITMDNVAVSLDRDHKRIDIQFCVKQKPKQ